MFEVSFGFKPTTHADRLLPLTGAPALVADRLSQLASVRDDVRELLTLSNNAWLLVLLDQHLLFLTWVILFSYPLRAYYIFTPKSANT